MTNRGPTRETRKRPNREFTLVAPRSRRFRCRSRGKQRVHVPKMIEVSMST